MRKISLILLFASFCLQLAAQKLQYKNYKWEENPKLHQLNEEDAALPELVIYKNKADEIAFDNDNVFSYYFVHKIVRVNSDDAIKNNNRVYIPTGNNLEVLATKARVINSKGEVKELNQDDIKEAEDEESKVSYQYFALEGVDKGSEVEYFFLLKRPVNMTGVNNTLQSDVKIKKVKFEILSPSHLIFDFKSLNGFSEMQQDTTIEDKNRWYVEQDDMPALKEEPMSAYEANLQGVIYKLEANTYTRKKNLYAYNTVAQNYYNNVTKTWDKKILKKVKTLLKESGVNTAESNEAKIRTLEQYIKSHFTYQSFSHPDLKNLGFILENKIASKLGLMRLYATCFEMLDIPFQLVLTSNRYEAKFDEEFESYSYLDDELFYMSKEKKYLAPTAVFSRFGYIPAPWTNNYGLFIKPVSLGEYKSAVGKIKWIKPLGHEYNSDTLRIDVNFEDISEPEIKFSKRQQGLDVLSIQPLYDYVEGDKKEELDESLAKFINEDADVEDVKVENEGGEYFGQKPLIVSAKLKDTELFVEKAGNKYLFKIGELIGPQMEMYQEKGTERQLDLELRYNHSYYRTIVFNIPEGYQIKNLDDLNFDVTFEHDGKTSAFFVSSYKIDGNTVTMYNEEVYDEMYYPKEVFEQYKDVINAAADFNKVTLVIEKK